MKSRLIDAISVTDSFNAGIDLGKDLVREHIVCVSYVLPVKGFVNNDGEVIERDAAMLIMKSKDVIFQDKLVPRVKEKSGQETVALPIVNVVTDYRMWVDQQVYDD